MENVRVTDYRKKIQPRGRIDVYRRTRLALAVFKSLGLAPMSVTRDKIPADWSQVRAYRSTNLKFVYTPTGWIYAFARSFALGVFCAFSVPRLIGNEYAYKSNLTMSIEVIEAIAGAALSWLLWLTIALKRKKIVKLLNRMIKSSTKIEDFLQWRTIVLSPLRAIVILVTIVAVWIATIVSDCVAYESTPIDWFNDVVPGIIMTGFILQYALLVKHLEIQFRNLNRAIVDSSGSSRVARTSRSSIQSDRYAEDFRMPKIIDFRRAHNDLYEIANEITDFYALPMLLTISLCNFEIIYNSYYVMMPFILEVGADLVWVIANGSLCVLALVIPIAVLARAVNSTIDEMTRTAEAVHKVFERTNISREDKAELKQFSIELLHRKVYFTAYGPVRLDCTLLHSMFSTVVSYIVILFQFQMSAAKYQSRSS